MPMAIWGAGIFENDAASSIKSLFDHKISKGKSVGDVTNMMLADYAAQLEDPSMRPAILTALAALQAEHGGLQPEVKAQALAVIDAGESIEAFAAAGIDRAARQAALQNLRELLMK